MSLRIQYRMPRRLLDGMDRLPAALSRGAELGLHRAALEVARDEKGRAPKAFGQLTNSVRAHRTGRMEWRVTPGGENPVRHAGPMEYGTRPGAMPPVENIRTWLRAKRIESSTHDERTLAFLIARGIARHGVRAHPYIRPTHDAMEPRVHDIVRTHLARGLRELRP